MPKLFCGHRSIAALFVIVGLVSAMPFYAQQAETEEQYINRLIKEATGAQPVQESRFPKQRTIDNAFRTQFRNLIQQNREFFIAINKVDKEKLKKLMTPESFANPQVGGDAVKEDDETLTGLNQRIKAANSQREDMLKAMQDYKTMQDQHMKASGIDPKTVGLQ